MRLELATFLAALGVIASPLGATAETIVQNDSLEMMFDGTSSAARLIEDEMYEAVFNIPEEWLPVEMLGVRVVMVSSNQQEDSSCPAPCSNACGRFGLDVWEEGSSAALSDNCIIGNVRYKNPGNLLFTQDSVVDPQTATVLGFEVRGDATRGTATFKDLRFSALNQVQGVTINPIVLNATQIRVAVRAIDLQCTAGGMIGSGDHFPVLISDQDGVGRPLSNFVYGQPEVSGFPICSSGMPQHYAWEDFAPAFMMSQPGDFIFRLILNRDDGMNMTPDMGMSTPDMGTDMAMAPDLGAGDTGGVVSDMAGNTGMNNGNNTTGAGLIITSVTPDQGDNATSTDIVIVGAGFKSGAEVLLDARNIGVTETQSGRIRATVPEGLSPAIYDLVVTNPDGETGILMNGFEVTQGAPDSDGNKSATSSGCCSQVPATRDGSGAALALVVLLVGGLFGRRRRNL